MPPPKNSFSNEFVGIYSFGIGLKYFNIFINLWASAYSLWLLSISCNNGIAISFSALNSYISDVLNILSASSWKGNIFFFSPPVTLCHVFNVFKAEYYVIVGEPNSRYGAYNPNDIETWDNAAIYVEIITPNGKKFITALKTPQGIISMRRAKGLNTTDKDLAGFRELRK